MLEMSKRITVTLPDSVYKQLSAWAQARGQQVAPLAAIAVEFAVRRALEDGEFSMPDPNEEIKT